MPFIKQYDLNMAFSYLLLFTLCPLITGQPTTTPGISKTDFLNFSGIEDPIIRLHSQEYNLFCPHTDLCNVKVNYNDSLFRYFGEYREIPCCGGCECNGNCLETLDCCIDNLPRLLTTDEVKAEQSNPAKCIYTQYRPFDSERYNGLAHIVVTMCSKTFSNKDVIGSCLKDYSEFDFVHNIPGYLPVTDNRTMTSYKNMHCALCNHVPRSDLIFWKAKVECSESIILGDGEKVQSLSDIEKLIKRDDRCNLVFEVPYFLMNREPFIKMCNPLIDKCNVTGLWTQYDAVLESLCTSYLSSYKGYKNVHCYLCNGYEISSITEVCIEKSPSWWPSSFVSLLDFNNLELSDTDDDEDLPDQKRCEEGKKYDILSETCRQLFCPEFMNLKNMECQLIFDEIYETTFDVRIRLIPVDETLDVRVIPTLQDLITDDVLKSVYRITSASVGLCNIQMFLKLEEKMTPRVERLQNASLADISFKERVRYVALRLLISAREVRNARVTIQEITNNIYSLDFDIIDGFRSEFVDLNFDTFEENLMPRVGTGADERPDPYNRYRFLKSYADPIDGRAILPVIPFTTGKCPQAFRLLPFLFCPLINIEASEFLVKENVIFLKQQGTRVNMSDVVFSENSSTITLCSDTFFSNEGKFPHRKPEPNPYEAEFIVSVVCTSISLICLFLVFVTYCCFRALRTLPGLNNMALVLSLFFAQLFYILGGAIEITADWLCEAIGLVLHLCLVASFFWMGICTFHMMMVFVFIAKRSGSENRGKAFIRYTVITIVAAVILVVINVIVAVTTSKGSNFGYGGEPCYIRDKHMILYTVAIPLGIVIICDFVMFLYVIIKVSRLPDVKKNTKHERKNIFIFAKLSTLTGLTWIFAYIYQWTGIRAFAFLFIVANASQGVFIMFSFVINKRVLGMLNTSYKTRMKTASAKTYTTSDGRSSQKSIERSQQEDTKI